MFAKWKTAQAAKRAGRETNRVIAENIEKDGYLRRLQNSARTLTATTYSGTGCDDTLNPYEIQAILRAKLCELTKPETEG